MRSSSVHEPSPLARMACLFAATTALQSSRRVKPPLGRSTAALLEVKSVDIVSVGMAERRRGLHHPSVHVVGESTKEGFAVPDRVRVEH